MTRRIFLAVVFLCAAAAPGVDAQALEPIRYTLRFPAPHTHYVEIEAAIPTGGRPQVFGHVVGFFLIGIAFGAVSGKRVTRSSTVQPLTFMATMLR